MFLLSFGGGFDHGPASEETSPSPRGPGHDDPSRLGTRMWVLVDPSARLHRESELAASEIVYAGVECDRIVAGAAVYVVHLPVVRADRVVVAAAGDVLYLLCEAVVGVYLVVAGSATYLVVASAT